MSMNNNAPRHGNRPAPRSRYKLALLLCLLAAVTLVLSACYMEPDRIVDDQSGLTVGGETQQFDTVITATPTPTDTPAPTTSTQQVDWSDWDFGADTATNPPSGSVTAPASTQGASGTITVGPSTTAPTTTATGEYTVLKSGSTGEEVKRLQTRLKELKYYTGTVDGSYGAGTVSAVKAFQAANNLTADGVAGKSTQEKLYSYYAISKDNASTAATAKPSSGSSSSSSSSSSSTSSSSTNKYTNGKTDIYLQLGSSGTQVKILQNRLIVLGYLSGTADGSFESTTQQAVIAFQERNKLYADGVAGPTTLTKLYSSSAKKAASVAANIGSLKEGMEGGGVRSMQQQLKTLGYYSGSVDGSFGAGTKAAVIAFQAANSLTQDGIAGKATLNAIYAAVNGGGGSGGGSGGGGSSSATNPSLYISTSTGYTTVSRNSSSSSNAVKAVQNALSTRGYYSGTLDGDYGTGTENAVKNFQAATGLRATGIAGPATQRMLYGSTGASGSYSSLKLGDSGSSVKTLQYALYELCYYDGDITGSYDYATENAVKLFQEKNGLTIDGYAGQATQQQLYSSYALPNK